MRTKSERGHLGWVALGTMLLVVACGGKNAENEGAGGSDDESVTPNSTGRTGGGSKSGGSGGSGQAGNWAGDDETEFNGGAGQLVTAGSGWGGTDSTPPSWGGTDSTPPSWGGTSEMSGGGAGGTPSDPEVTCKDGFKSEAETDIDCGGPYCGPCPATSSCARHQDCKSLVCRAAICQTPSCQDETKNGSETGVDCGGSCAACAE